VNYTPDSKYYDPKSYVTPPDVLWEMYKAGLLEHFLYEIDYHDKRELEGKDLTNVMAYLAAWGGWKIKKPPV
jgi:hypothetical protein